MKLAELIAVMGEHLHGRAGHDVTARILFGDPSSQDAQRLSIYRRFCDAHRHEALSVFEHTRSAVVSFGGAVAWSELVDAYFRGHPMTSFELNEGGAAFSSFLSRLDPPLPRFVAELADFEWWEWRTSVAPDDPRDREPGKGALRLASTVELRRYGFDLVDWLAGGEAHGEPAERSVTVLFWRDAMLHARRQCVNDVDIWLLALVSSERRVADALRTLRPAEMKAALQALEGLMRAGVLLGVYRS
jgi:hypothetical protein